MMTSMRTPYAITSGGIVLGRAANLVTAHRTSRKTGRLGSSISTEWQNRAEATPDLATRYIGECQVCERDIKMHEGFAPTTKRTALVLVHHGYKRPGHGSIEGDCPGVGEEPYETSVEVTKNVRDAVAAAIVISEKYLSDLEEGRVHELRVSSRFGREAKVYKRGEQDFEWVLRDKISRVKNDLYYLRLDHARLVKRVETWQPRSIRTLEEERQKTEVVRAQREEVKAAKRAEREAKEAAKLARKQAMESKREAIRKDLAAKFTALDAAGDRVGAAKLAHKLGKYQKWLFYDAESLGIDDVLIRLGLAHRAAHNQQLYWTSGSFG